MTFDDRAEWLEADGLGGFASGTVSGTRTRRYHALLLSATTPPTGRVALVNGFDAWVDTASGSFALSTQKYTPDVAYPDGATHIAAFMSEPWPTWEYALPNGTRIRQEIFALHRTGTVVVSWRLLDGPHDVVLRVRPFLSGRDYHSMHRENGGFRFAAEPHGVALTFRPYDGIPDITMGANGTYRHAPEWYRQFLYAAERERGLDAIEDLASPGELSWPLPVAGAEAMWTLTAGPALGATLDNVSDLVRLVEEMRATERRRRALLPTALDRAADAYLVQRGAGMTIVAGYPWFTDWGRDTFIAIRGLCLATRRFSDARDILLEWAGAVSEGMLPNRFPDHGEASEFNAVDASLWFIVAAAELIQSDRGRSNVLTPDQRRSLEAAILKIVDRYAAGTRFGIRLDSDGLLAAGAPGTQLTWMDARVGDREITPRIGKPVEVQALWLNALAIATELDTSWRDVLEQGKRSFNERFWTEKWGHLADVVDVDHVRGTRDDSFRPNQILAIGGLPLALVDGDRARRIVDAAERELLTPVGLRSLASFEPGYAPRYEGDSSARDAVYHQGTVWPWLIGPFVEAWIRVHGNTIETRREARERFVAPLMEHLQSAGLGHISEIADAQEPFTPHGCPFQAWSVGELLRLDRVVLAEPASAPTRETASASSMRKPPTRVGNRPLARKPA